MPAGTPSPNASTACAPERANMASRSASWAVRTRSHGTVTRIALVRSLATACASLTPVLDSTTYGVAVSFRCAINRAEPSDRHASVHQRAVLVEHVRARNDMGGHRQRRVRTKWTVEPSSTEKKRWFACLVKRVALGTNGPRARPRVQGLRRALRARRTGGASRSHLRRMSHVQVHGGVERTYARASCHRSHGARVLAPDDEARLRRWCATLPCSPSFRKRSSRRSKAFALRNTDLRSRRMRTGPHGSSRFDGSHGGGGPRHRSHARRADSAHADRDGRVRRPCNLLAREVFHANGRPGNALAAHLVGLNGALVCGAQRPVHVGMGWRRWTFGRRRRAFGW